MSEQVIRVEYRVPVWVHVDLDAGEIVSVHVDDVGIEGPVDVVDFVGAPVPSAVLQRAAELVRDDTTWPAWMIGFDHT
jgi:hypothetical protein